MKKLIIFSFILLSYHILLLITPVIIFLSTLSFTPKKFLDGLYLIFLILAVFSPILTIALSYRISQENFFKKSWLAPIIISFIGFSPFYFFYFFVSSLWNPRDFLLIVSFPILLGLIAFWIAKFQKFFKRQVFK